MRVCGICVKNGRILLVNHALYGPDGIFWSPPGGGIRFGETAEEALMREFQEETGLNVTVGKMRFVYEHIEAPLHAVELFFEIVAFKGELRAGYDPELPADRQIISAVRFMGWDEIASLDHAHCHRMLKLAGSEAGIFESKNYISGAKSRSNP